MSGKRAAVAIMDLCDKDMEYSPEEQLDKLQRAYRPADLKRAMFYSKSQSALDKQQHIIDILDKEKAELEFKYNRAREIMFLKEDAMWLRDFEDLLSCQSTSKAIKDEEIRKIKETDEKIRQLDKQMHRVRLKLVQMRKSKCPATSNEKVVQILESKLYQENVAHNIAIYKNSILREYIQHLLILRTHFNIIYGHYNKFLSKGKGRIERLSKQAIAAQEQRDEIRSHLISLKKYNALQYNKLVSEVQEMSRLAKLKGQHIPFMMKKEKIRVGYLESLGTKLELEKADAKPEEQLKFYQDTFEKIKAATHQTDASEIVKHFIQAEEDNFKLFNYANELRDEIEHIQEKINNFQERLRETNMQDQIEEEKFNARKEMMEEQLKKIAVDRSSLQEKLDLCQKAFSEFQEGIIKLYSKSGCSDEYLCNLLYGAKGITKHSILDYLSTLECWISDIIPFSDYLVTMKNSSGIADKATDKLVTSSKYDVHSYSKLSTLSGNITPSIQTSISSREPSPDIEDVKTLIFTDFALPELSREHSSTAFDELQSLKQPYTKSELKIVANGTLLKSEATEERLMKK